MAAPICKHVSILNRILTTANVRGVVQPQKAIPLVLTQVRHKTQKKNAKEVKVKTFASKDDVRKKRAGHIYSIPNIPYTAPTNVKMKKSWIARMPYDDVYLMKRYPTQNYTLDEALLMCKEVADPYTLNSPEYVHANFFFNMHTKIEGKYLKTVRTSILPPVPFAPEQELQIAVLTASEENQDKARSEGAVLVGDGDLLERIASELVDISNIDVVISTPDVQEALIKHRKLLKEYFHVSLRGSQADDITGMIEMYKQTLKIHMEPLEKGTCKATVPLGQLNMPVEDLMENFQAVLSVLLKSKSSLKKNMRADVPFLYKASLNAVSSEELFHINPEDYDVQNPQKET